MKVGSLFSGIGGIELGFERAGFKTEWFIERDPYAKEILKKRFPNTKIYEDVTEIDFESVPKVDILTGGFPCQNISNAGKRAGIEGSRSSLWKYYLKAIRTIRPKVAFIENVSALLGRGLSVVLCDLAKNGYDAEWYCISASTVGANHRRDRIFIIAYPHINRESDESIYGEKRQRFLDEVPNSDGERRNDGSHNREGRYVQSNKKWNVTQDKQEGNGRKYRSGEISSDVSNSNSIGSTQKSNRRTNEGGREGWQGLWAIEPELGRVADGVPNRVDRIKCIGNAVVPQVAEVFAQAIKEGE